MKVVLIENVKNVGKIGEIVEVKDGYGRNYLIKNKKGLPGTKENIEKALKAQEEHAKLLAEDQASAQLQAKLITETTITLRERAGAEGQLFGSVTNKDIAAALKAQAGIEVDKRKILLEDPIRSIGKFEVRIKTYAGVEGTLTVIVEKA